MFVKWAERRGDIQEAFAAEKMDHDRECSPKQVVRDGAVELLTRSMHPAAWHPLCPPTIVKFAIREDSATRKAGECRGCR